MYYDVDQPSTSKGGLTCHDAICTSCMAAPCFQVVYDGVFDLTCICPVVGWGDTCSFSETEDNADGHLCDEISATNASCAASANGAASEYTWGELEDFVGAILDADPKQGDAAQCPSQGVTWFEHEANSSRVDSTDNRQELNVSHVLERNSTHSRGDANRSHHDR